MRTFVYPLVLKVSNMCAEGGWGAVIIQYGCAIASILFFHRCLLRCQWDSRLALAASSCLLYSPMLLEYSSALTPDLLAHSLSVAAIGAWLVVINRGHSSLDFVLMTSLTFLAYQSKPAYLFLLVFVPIGGLIARWWLHRSSRDWWSVAARLAVGAWGPFLLYCAARWLIVGQFGLVSFGGYNLVGITGQLLRSDEVAGLSDEVRPFAERLVAERSKREGWDNSISYTSIELQFNTMVWSLAVPIANDLTSNDSIATNRLLTRFSGEVIRNDPKTYMRWLVIAIKHAFTETVTITSRNIGFLFAVAGLILIHFWRGWQAIYGVPTAMHCAEGSDVEASLANGGANGVLRNAHARIDEYQTMVWLALGYAACKFALVVLVEPPISRYAAPAVVFLPSIVAMGMASYLLARPKA